MKYAVAYMNFFDNDLQMTVVAAENPAQAMIEGARTLMGAPDDDDWLNMMLKDTPDSDNYAARIEAIKEEFFNTDQVIDVISVE